MEQHKIAALYCRLSKHEDAKIESNSIANQKTTLLKAAQSYGYEHTQFFIDDGYSGTVFQRPALNDLEEAIKAGTVDVVIVKDVSRLGRNYLKVGHFVEHFFPMYNVRFIAVSGGIDSSTNSTDFLPLYSVMDEWYARDISRKLKTMYQARAAKGEPIGIPVYGYTRSQNNPKHWEPDPKSAVIVQRIFHLALVGYGVEQIAGLLETEKVLTPTHYRLSHGKKCGGRIGINPYKWASSTIAQILGRQEYCGDVINLKTYSHSLRDNKRRQSSPDNRIILKDVHKPIIERSIWEYVQQKRIRNKAIRRASKPSLFSGFLRCGDCGSNLHYHFNQKNPSIEYYSCSNYVGNRGTCPETHYIRLDYLDKHVLDKINALLSSIHNNWDYFIHTCKQQKLSEIQAQGKTSIFKHKTLIINRQEELASIIAQLYEDKIKGEIDDETYHLLTAKFKSERSGNRQKIQVIQKHIRHSQITIDEMKRFWDTVARHSQVGKITREVLHELVDYIRVYSAVRNGKEYTQKIEIHYLYVGQLGMENPIARR